MNVFWGRLVCPLQGQYPFLFRFRRDAPDAIELVPFRDGKAPVMNNFSRGHEFASAVGKCLAGMGLKVEPEYSVQVGVGSNVTRGHRFDFGSPAVLVECKCSDWTDGGNNPSTKISTLNEAIRYFHSTPEKFRKMLFLPKTSKAGALNVETFAEYYVRLHGHFIPTSVEIWELDITTGVMDREGSKSFR